MQLKPYMRENVLCMPVVLISTVSKDGILNAAPWGNVTPILRPLDEIMIASWIKRDTLDNIRDTGEFVVNVVPSSMIEEVMVCSKNFPPETDEFCEAKLKPKKSHCVSPPGIEGCISWIECSLKEEIKRDKYSIVIGKIEHLEADDAYFDESGNMDYEKAKPLCMMCGDDEISYVRPVCAGRTAKYSEMFTGR
ncbi:flavin reductase (DIM6/NTAB) family NADH-FMN oxidoreductase RutF [Methanomicrobium sp. W14]|uniref:flavin reductase family protein n=1 Tax=Methanomicrobium sp. W14 TaxID=2817839 RepID=UPI001AE53B47|nr:flavin reductase family protein [Methanomicrobium sp. W14]MBP2133388.1 flavin reductase (DIM6/NTAB) family NADH-FMN oxidoreductase RutF [Methanomicrobium sp. W14]